MSREQTIEADSGLSELTDEQLHGEYVISQETLAYHKEQVGHVSSQLHELTLKLVEKKKETYMLRTTTVFELNSHVARKFAK